MNASDRRALKLITQSKGDVRASLKSFLAKQLRHKVMKPMKAARLDKEEQTRLSKKDETARIRGACMVRAAGACEWCKQKTDHLEMDHFLGGIGRRRQKQRIANCWMLCFACHRAKTNNAPTTSYWNAAFAVHAIRHDYPALTRIEHAPVVRKSSRALGLGQRVPPTRCPNPNARDLPKVIP